MSSFKGLGIGIPLGKDPGKEDIDGLLDAFATGTVFVVPALSSAEASLCCGEAGEKEKESAQGTMLEPICGGESSS